MNPAIANLSELYVAPGGATYSLLQRFSRARNIKPSVARRIVILLLITWVPMLVFAVWQGNALGPTPRDSLLLDFATYVRFFLIIPVLVAAESLIGWRLRTAGLQFVHDGLVREEDYPAFEQAIARLAGRRESVIAALVILALAAFGAWKLTLESATGIDVVNWASITRPEGHAYRYSLAGVWSHLVALPVMLFLWYRWLWRMLFWGLFLRDVSRLDLRLVPTHADRMGGLGFLEIAHKSFATMAFAIGCMFSAEAAFRVLYEGAQLEVFQAGTLGLLVLMQVIFLGPLLVFAPIMARTRRAALRAYGSLVVRYNREFDDKWVKGSKAPGEPLLGSADIQSLADLGNSFRFVSDMQFVPIGRGAMFHLALATLLPGLPLLLLVVPLSEILDTLGKLVL